MNRKIYQKELKDWNNNARFYGLEALSPFKKILREETRIKFLLGQKNQKILDLGAGVGDFAEYLTQRFKDEVICLDFSISMKRLALKRNPGLNYILASAEKLPFPDSTFDAVLAGGLLHHLKTQGILKESLGEVYRVLKRGGRFCYLDRSNSFIADYFEGFLSSIRQVFLKFKTGYAASSTISETSLTAQDRILVREKFKFVSRSSIYSMPFKFLMVVSNFLYYLFGQNFYLGFQKLVCPLAYFAEKYLNFKLWETESCEVLEKS